MKTIKYFFITVCMAAMLPVSCIVDPDLKEVPKSFLSPENAFVDKAGFESALAHIYRTLRQHIYLSGYPWYTMLGMDTDLTCRMQNDYTFTEYEINWNTLNKDNNFVRTWWQNCYKWIFLTNTVIERAEDSGVKWASEEEKNQIVAEAYFVRAFAYRFLGSLYGGVPIVLTETASAKFDYTRASQEEVWKQCKEDLQFATQWMKTVDRQQGGRAPRAAAYNLLSEICINLGDYDGAIAAASKVIDDPNFHLMTERFGVRKNFTFGGYSHHGTPQPWGDVYWDLFQEGNMNWSEGNNEAIWNIEMDPYIVGGGNDNQWGGNFLFERVFDPLIWLLTDKDGKSNWLMDTLSGRPVGGTTASVYVGDLIWRYKGDWDKDIRNSEYNIQRDYYWTNPNSAFFGQIIRPEHMGVPTEYKAYTSPSFKKYVAAVHYGLFTDAASGQKHDQGCIYKDWYIMRLPETYLLRAEAYMRKNDLANAAKDINIVRGRAKATPVVASDVNLDLILDERARELYIEEFRLVTLTRTGTLAERLMKYHGAVAANGYNLPAHRNKFPIPQSEIEANKGAVLEQNPGYE